MDWQMKLAKIALQNWRHKMEILVPVFIKATADQRLIQERIERDGRDA